MVDVGKPCQLSINTTCLLCRLAQERGEGSGKDAAGIERAEGNGIREEATRMLLARINRWKAMVGGTRRDKGLLYAMCDDKENHFRKFRARTEYKHAQSLLIVVWGRFKYTSPGAHIPIV